MDPTSEYYPPLVVRRATPMITARYQRSLASYTRAVAVAQPLLVAVVVAVGIARMAGALLLSALRAGTGARSARRSLRELRKGPEFLVTPLRLLDDLGVLYEVELHGHLPQSALQRGDLVQVTTRAPSDPTLPVKVDRLVNLTTCQLLTPYVPTLWSHLGPALVLQAALGTVLAAVVGLSALS